MMSRSDKVSSPSGAVSSTVLVPSARVFFSTVRPPSPGRKTDIRTKEVAGLRVSHLGPQAGRQPCIISTQERNRHRAPKNDRLHGHGHDPRFESHPVDFEACIGCYGTLQQSISTASAMSIPCPP